jgi:hypothetical protein
MILLQMAKSPWLQGLSHNVRRGVREKLKNSTWSAGELHCRYLPDQVATIVAKLVERLSEKPNSFRRFSDMPS